MRVAGEHYFHTRDQVAGYIDEARAIVAGLELDDDLRVPAFIKAMDLLANKQVQFEQVNPNALGILPQLRG